MPKTSVGRCVVTITPPVIEPPPPSSWSRMGYHFGFGVWLGADFGPGGHAGFEQWIGRGRLDSMRIMTGNRGSTSWSAMRSIMNTSAWRSHLANGYRVHGTIRCAPQGFVAGGWNATQESRLRAETQTTVNQVQNALGASFNGENFIMDLCWEYNNASYMDSLENSRLGGFTPAQWRQMWIVSRDIWKAKFPKMKFAFNSLMGFGGHGEWPGLQFNDIWPGANKADFLGADMYSKAASAASNPNGWYMGSAASDGGSVYFPDPGSPAEWMNLARNKGVGLWCGETGLNFEFTGDAWLSRRLLYKGFRKFAREGRFAEISEFHSIDATPGNATGGGHNWVTISANGTGSAVPGRSQTFAVMRDILRNYNDAAFGGA